MTTVANPRFCSYGSCKEVVFHVGADIQGVWFTCQRDGKEYRSMACQDYSALYKLLNFVFPPKGKTQGWVCVDKRLDNRN